MDESTLARSDRTSEYAHLVRMRELDIREQEIKLAASLNDLGLRGTLTGALAGLALVLALAVLSVISDKIGITGLHLCVLTGVVALAVVALGAFVFNRSASVVADFQKQRVNVQIREDRVESDRHGTSKE